MAYLKEILIPSLQKGDIVVMDHMRSHHVREVAETLHAAGIELWYGCIIIGELKEYKNS